MDEEFKLGMVYLNAVNYYIIFQIFNKKFKF